MAEDEVRAPNREMQRDRGVLIPRVFNFNNGNYGNLPRDDNIGLDTYKSMMKDSQVKAGIEVVRLATIGSGWEFNFPYQEDPDKANEILMFIRGVFGGMNKSHGLRSDMFQVFNEVLSALWAGFSVTEKVWGKDDKGRWVIKKYKVLPPETIKFNINKQGVLSPTEAVEQSYLVRDNIKLPARKVNIFIVNPNFGSPWGESILKPVYNNWYVKDWMVKFHASYMENLGSPILIGKTNRDTVTMNNALQEARNSSVITLSENEDVDLLNAGGSGGDFEDAIRYHDAQIMRGMLVPSLLVGQDEAMGSRALSEVHFEMFKLSRIGALQQQLRTWINNDIREMVRLNFGEFDFYPELTFKSWSRSDQQRLSSMIVDLVNAQVVTPNEAWIREFLELPDAGEDYDPKAWSDTSTVSPTRQPEDREVPPQVREPGEGGDREQLETYQPPVGAKNNAKKALRWKEEHGSEVKAMTATGWARARQLASGKPISRKTLGRMAAFNRHRKNSKVDPKYKSEPWKDNGYVAWLGWGGTTGINWAMNKMKTVDNTALVRGPMEDYVFIDKDMAIAISEEIGMEGRVHKSILGDGTVAWIPGGTEEEFFKWYDSEPEYPLEQFADEYATEEEAQTRADEIGCVGTHYHDTPDGRIYMPCETHEAYDEAIGDLATYPKKKKKKKKKYYTKFSQLAEDDYPDINAELQREIIASFSDSKYAAPEYFDRKKVNRTLAIILTRGGVALSDTERKALELREMTLSQTTDADEIAFCLGVIGVDGTIRLAND